MSSLTPKIPIDAGGAAAPLPVTCPGCQRAFRVRADLAGKRVKCPKCAQSVPIPLPAPPEPELEVAEVDDAPAPTPMTRWLFYAALAMVGAMVYGCAITASLYPNQNRHLGAEYYNIAKSLIQGEGYANPFEEKTGPTAWMPPILSTILAGLIWLCEDDVNALQWIVVGIQVHVLLATGWLVVALARKTSPRPVIAAFVSATIYCLILLSQFRLCFQTTHDCWLVLLAMDGFVYGLCWHQPMATNRSAAVWGLCGGTFSLINPIVGFAWAAMCGITAVRERQWKPLALAFLIATLVHAPWTIRNYYLFGRIIPIKSNLAYELYQSQCLQKDGLLQANTFGTHPYTHPNKARREYKQKGEIPFLDEKRQLFFDSVMAEPLDFCDRVVSRFLGCLVWYQSFDLGFERLHPWVTWLNLVLHPLPLLAILVLAYSAFWRPLHPAMWAVIGICLLYQIPYVIISYYERYAVPVIGAKAILTFWLFDRTWSLIARTPEANAARAIVLLAALLLVPATASAQQKTVVYDLSRDMPEVKLYGPHLDTAIHREPQGLRITLDPARGDKAPVGVEIPMPPLKGNFEISVGYELLKIGTENLSKFGSGVALRLRFDTPNEREAMMSRTKRTTAENATAFKITRKPDGKEDYVWSGDKKATSPKGRLRIARTGGLVKFSFKDGDANYVPLKDMEMGAEDILFARIYATTTYEPAEFEVRLNDMTIVADNPPPPPVVAKEADVAMPPTPSSGRGRLLGAAGILLALVIGAIGIYWIKRSRM